METKAPHPPQVCDVGVVLGFFFFFFCCVFIWGWALFSGVLIFGVFFFCPTPIAPPDSLSVVGFETRLQIALPPPSPPPPLSLCHYDPPPWCLPSNFRVLLPCFLTPTPLFEPPPFPPLPPLLSPPQLLPPPWPDPYFYWLWDV